MGVPAERRIAKPLAASFDQSTEAIRVLLRLGKQPAVRRKGFYSQRLEDMRGEVPEIEGDDDISAGGIGSRDDMGIGLVDQLR